MSSNSEKYYLYDAVSIGICVIDSHHKILCWNETLSTWTGLDKEAVLNKNLLEIFSNFSSDVLKERLQSVFRDGLPIVISSKLHPSIFPRIWPIDVDPLLEIKITAIDDKEINQRHAVITIEDVSDQTKRLREQRILYKRAIEEVAQRKKAENELKISERKLKEAIITKDRFFSIIAHDLKSPFASMISYSKLMLEERDEYCHDSIQQMLKTINDMANNGFALLENLLNWSRLQTGRINFNPEAFDLYTICTEAIKLLAPIAKEKHIELKLDILESQIIADVNMFRTVLRNLIANAIKFSHPNSSIIIGGDINEAGAYRLYVKDTGVGIAKKNIPKLFNMSTPYTTYGTQKEVGTGLGLILCKEFIEMHSGKIWIESEEGKGSIFYFTIPQNKTKSISDPD